jgi:hypothetical protein
LTAAVIGFLTAYKLYKTPKKLIFVFIVLFSVGSLLIFGEEISWGQRIAGFSTPEAIKQVNTQHEFSAHNLVFIQRYTAYAYYVICAYACLGWIVFAFEYFRKAQVLRYVIPGWETITLFSPIAIFYYLYHFYFNSKDLQHFFKQSSHF